MKTKITWLAVSCLTTVALMLTSCAPAEKEEAVEKEAVERKAEAKLAAEVVLTPEEMEAIINEGEATITLTSPAFGEGEKIPAKYTCDGEDISPPLAWDEPPEGSSSPW